MRLLLTNPIAEVSMMERIFLLFLLIVQSLVSSEAQEETTSSDPLQTSTRDPYANVLSQLSDAIFDVEDRLYRLTAPKPEQENTKSFSDEDNNRRRNYFDRIRDNYKTLQDQLGQSVNTGGVIKMSDILNLNFQNKGPRSYLDLSMPFLPLSIRVDSKQPKEASEKVDKDSLKLPQIPDINGNINLGLKNIFNQETQSELQKRSSRLTRSSQANRKVGKDKISEDLFGDSSKAYMEQSNKDRDAESGVEGRILGDLLFSENTFDTYFRRLLNDHGKWLLDSNIMPPKQIIESIRDVTRNRFTASTSKNKSQKERFSETSSNYKKGANLKSSKHDTEARVILAFTPEGLPLKLKMDPNAKKPLKFLHEILSEEKVSLNVPVSTSSGIHHVGNGVLHLGFEDKTPTRTPVLDLSDNNQLNYFLKTLKKLRYDHH